MRNPQVDVIIKPFTLRFSLCNGVPVYHIGADAQTQLDEMENLMGIDTEKQVIFDCNLGFLPICSTVLIRGEKTILVDPGYFHIGFYGMIGRALAPYRLQPTDVDLVILTHSHADHLASTFLFQESHLVVGEGELEAGRASAWPEFIDAFTVARVKGVEIIPAGDKLVELSNKVYVMHTPGHTPGSISVLVETSQERVAIIGDTALSREEYVGRALSHWYATAQEEQINRSLDRIASWNPTTVIPGHDFEFRVSHCSTGE